MVNRMIVVSCGISLLMLAGCCVEAPPPTPNTPAETQTPTVAPPAAEAGLPGGTPEELPVRQESIQALLDAAADGSTVRIPSGTYISEKIVVLEDRKDLTIICDGPVNIFCRNTDMNVLALVRCSNITLVGARMRHEVPLEEYECHGGVVAIFQCKNVLLYRCEMDGCGAIGVGVGDSKDVWVHKCYVHSNSFLAFSIGNTEDMKITDCRIVNNKSMLAMSASVRKSSLPEEDAPWVVVETLGSIEMWGNTIENNTGYWAGSRGEGVIFPRLDELARPK